MDEKTEKELIEKGLRMRPNITDAATVIVTGDGEGEDAETRRRGDAESKKD